MSFVVCCIIMIHILYNSGVELKNVLCFDVSHSVYEIHYIYSHFKHFWKMFKYVKLSKPLDSDFLTFLTVIEHLKKSRFILLILGAKFDWLEQPLPSSMVKIC